MIAKIKGKIVYLRDHYVVVDVNGVGYKIFVTDFAMGKIAGKEEIELYTILMFVRTSCRFMGF
jgi:Holliday junction resolvasome RuvABC DNA-binding subunit